MSVTKKTFRGTRKAFIRLEEAQALKLLKMTHIEIGWVCCRIRRKTSGFLHWEAAILPLCRKTG